jgi:hypothetical protein
MEFQREVSGVVENEAAAKTGKHWIGDPAPLLRFTTVETRAVVPVGVMRPGYLSSPRRYQRGRGTQTIKRVRTFGEFLIVDLFCNIPLTSGLVLYLLVLYLIRRFHGTEFPQLDNVGERGVVAETDESAVRANFPLKLRLSIPEKLFGLSLEECEGVGVDEDVVIDVPESLQVGGFHVVENQDQGEDVSRDNLCFEVAASEVKLPVVCSLISIM